MAISKTALTDLINKHNNPADETVIYNIQSTSGSNFFAGRLLGNIGIDGDDLVFTEVENNGEVFTLRTGMDNIDIIKVKLPSELSAVLVKVAEVLTRIEGQPALAKDATIAPLVVALRALNHSSDPGTAKTKYADTLAALKTQEQTRTSLIEQAKRLEEVKDRYVETFGAVAVNYLFTDFHRLLDDLQGSVVVNSDFNSTITNLEPIFEGLATKLETFLEAKAKKDTDVTAAAEVEAFLTKIRNKESLD